MQNFSNIFFSQLASICGGTCLSLAKDSAIKNLCTDSRKVVVADTTIFFAIVGERHDGHDYVRTLYETGVRQFVVEKQFDLKNYPQANMLLVKSAVEALQKLAAYHRSNFSYPVIGITGSNGKTIVKEWLYQLLAGEFNVVKNPGSYNSQIGVPLSIWNMQTYHQLGLFEAGISKPGEMGNLQKIIQPTVGIFTNIGTAHDENFSSTSEKIQEKLSLFENTETVIYCRDHETIHAQIVNKKCNRLSWGFTSEAQIQIIKNNGEYDIRYRQKTFNLRLPFTDQASIENAFHCITALLYLNYDVNTIRQRIQSLRSVPMRLELKEGINHCQIIDDTYNNDLGGLQISLDFLTHQHQKKTKVLILSDILESGLPEEELVEKINTLIQHSGIHYVIGIGKVLSTHKNLIHSKASVYTNTENFLSNFDFSTLEHAVILVKGARTFHFEKIIGRLQKQVHGTIMEVDLGALVYNLNYFKSKLRSGTRLMVMVKAFAYGSGSVEVANVLQYHQVDYLGVAYADEGVTLRKNNISLPIMVMNPTVESFHTMLQFDLEPELYSFSILKSFIEFLDGKDSAVHIKVDTGMHRLGFEEADSEELIALLNQNKNLKVESIFSHLAGSDEMQHDKFTRAQAAKFLDIANRISLGIGYTPLKHLINTPGILRFPEFQFDMVRLGVGLYGVDPTTDNHPLRPVATLKTVVSQIRSVKKDETVGYGRYGKAQHDMEIATIAIGYADGYNRAFSRGVGKVWINGYIAPVIGNVCMDMTMVDVTGLPVKEGDTVIIFGKDLPIQRAAEAINTIPYEILTNTSERVKRVFVAESI